MPFCGTIARKPEAPEISIGESPTPSPLNASMEISSSSTITKDPSSVSIFWKATPPTKWIPAKSKVTLGDARRRYGPAGAEMETGVSPTVKLSSTSASILLKTTLKLLAVRLILGTPSNSATLPLSEAAIPSGVRSNAPSPSLKRSKFTPPASRLKARLVPTIAMLLSSSDNDARSKLTLPSTVTSPRMEISAPMRLTFRESLPMERVFVLSGPVVTVKGFSL